MPATGRLAAILVQKNLVLTGLLDDGAAKCVGSMSSLSDLPLDWMQPKPRKPVDWLFLSSVPNWRLRRMQPLATVRFRLSGLRKQSTMK